MLSVRLQQFSNVGGVFNSCFLHGSVQIDEIYFYEFVHGLENFKKSVCCGKEILFLKCVVSAYYTLNIYCLWEGFIHRKSMKMGSRVKKRFPDKALSNFNYALFAADFNHIPWWKYFIKKTVELAFLKKQWVTEVDLIPKKISSARRKEWYDLLTRVDLLLSSKHSFQPTFTHTYLCNAANALLKYPFA